MYVKIKDIIKVCNGKLICGNEEDVCIDFSKDTRTIQENDVYVGIKGENFDGNTLYLDAFEKGAKACILQGIEIDKETIEKYKNKSIIIVDDTIKALQEIAKFKRSLYNIPVIAITGSVGKTSTKDIIASVVGEQYKVLKTQGNLNNHIGVPLTILSLKEHEALVVEMGMSNAGELTVLSKIAQPDIAVITNVGTAHIGNLGSRENILKAKLEILNGLKENGTLIINNDNDMLNAWKTEYNGNVKIVTYGIENASDFKACDIKLNENSSEFSLESQIDNNEKIMVPVGGMHFVYNALSAIAVGEQLNIPIEKIKNGIANFELTKSRMELIKLENEITVVNDCYNANYDSMKASIEYLAKTNSARKIAILGDMLELGDFSNELHAKVGEEVAKNKIDILITVGEMGKVIANSAKQADDGIEVYSFDNNQSAITKINELKKSGDTILIKASNGMKFKEIVEGIIKK